MAYADQKMSGSRIVAIVIVALIHAVIGYAFVTGLAFQYVKKVQEKLNTFDVAEEPPPPPDEPPPPPPDIKLAPPPVVSPPPIVTTTAPPTVVFTTPVPPPPAPVIVAPPAPPPPAPPRVSKAAGAKGDPRQWITQDDFPEAAKRANAEGTTAIAWDIGLTGRVENCRVTSSSGNSSLDDAACRALIRKARYSPAVDQDGRPIKSSSSRRVVWKLEQ